MPSFKVADAQLAYEVSGSGPCVLFVQGVGMTGRGWSPQIRELARDYQCVALDNRGIGASTGDTSQLSVELMARDALALLDALRVERAHLVGHSLGGVIVQHMALSAPARVSSLSFLCTFAGGRDLASPSAKLMWLGALSRIGPRESRRRAFARLITSDTYLRKHGKARTIAELEDVFGRPLWQAPPLADIQLRALRAYDQRERLHELAAQRCIVLSGRQDPIATHEANATLAQLTGARHRVWDHASHALPIHHAAGVNAALRAHFAQA